ncbi:thioredoxin family protein [Portibacter lacus]|uniref:Thiol reductase thioredoxin n=1 Tax=Portibacter lacus TaxID=1099794 RepID=A0AA37SSU4_9BACT|nr:thioredoxin family protein [Portibacter lacus]GLR18096.1 thiol reductase thioredoxin [Portibacter lacus]
MNNINENIHAPNELISLYMKQENNPILLVFDAEWSSTSSMTEIITKKIRKEAKNIKLVKIDIDQEENLARKYRIKKVPTCMLLINNELKYRYEGLFSKSMVLQALAKNS